MQKIACVFFIGTLFLACSTKFDIPKNIPNFSQKAFEILNKNDKNILLVSQNGKIYNFIYLNPLGIPITKKTLKNGTFKADGFFKPNKNHDVLFIKILNFIKFQRKKDKITLKNTNVYKVREIDLFE